MLQQQGDFGDSHGQFLGASLEHRSSQIRPHGNRISPEDPNFRSTAQQSNSGTTHKKRKTAD
jgi:hypothetical protein